MCWIGHRSRAPDPDGSSMDGQRHRWSFRVGAITWVWQEHTRRGNPNDAFAFNKLSYRGHALALHLQLPVSMASRTCERPYGRWLWQGFGPRATTLCHGLTGTITSYFYETSHASLYWSCHPVSCISIAAGEFKQYNHIAPRSCLLLKIFAK